jgi:hypothetical protein
MRGPAIVALMFVVGCSRAITPPLTVKAARDLGSLRNVVVLPASASPTMNGEAAAQSADAVSRMLSGAVSRETQWAPVGGAREQAALAKLAADSPEARAGELAAALQADAAVTATITAYRERIGTAYGATEPASVSVQILLVRAGQNQAAWRADYTQTQEPLTYNLWNFWGFLRGGPKWLTADELARIGVDEAVKELAAATR